MNAVDLPFSKARMRRRVREPREIRQSLKKECDELWSLIIRKLYKVCQHCGSKKDLQAHHIISKTRLQRMKNQLGRWDLNNGVRLCKGCHLYWLKDYPDEYDTWIRDWLKAQGRDFDELLALSKLPSKADLTVVKLSLELQLKALK